MADPQLEGGSSSIITIIVIIIVATAAYNCSTRSTEVFRKRRRRSLMCQHKYKRSRVVMNIKMCLHTAAAEHEGVRCEQRDQEREWESVLE